MKGKIEVARGKFERGLELVALGFTTYQTGAAIYARGQEWLDSRKPEPDVFYLTISDDDEIIWSKTRKWLFKQLGEVDRRHIDAVESGWTVVEVPANDITEFDVLFKGEPVRVSVRMPERPEVNVQVQVFDHNKKMTLVFPSMSLRDDFVDFIREMMPTEEEVRAQRRVFRSRSKVAGWSFMKKLPERSLDSVILNGNMLEEILADMRQFETNHQKYTDRGIPWHRGYLLHGPPGTGKSSVITALAAAMERDVYFMSIPSLDSDNDLFESMSDLSHRCILVLEDVDSVKSTRKRNEQEAGSSEKVTIGGLLNALDGIMTPDGLITVMTTNHPDRLDPALLRPGRADRKYELTYLDQDQLNRMIARFVGPEFAGAVDLQRVDVSPSEIVECLKSGFDFPPEHVIECIREVVSSGYQKPVEPKPVNAAPKGGKRKPAPARVNFEAVPTGDPGHDW